MQFDEEATDKCYGDAAYAYTCGRFNEALAGFSKLAESGNAMATAYLAEMHLRGEGVPPDVDKGLELLQRAAALGDDNAAFSLGALYRTGAYGVPKDPVKSRQFFLLAMDLGSELPIEEYL